MREQSTHKQEKKRTECRGQKNYKEWAVRREVGGISSPLWVYNEKDWALLSSSAPGTLLCPEPSCGSPFTAVRENSRGTRWLVDKPGSDCTHRAGGVTSGGPMSLQHRWLQERMSRILTSLGYVSVIEHYPTRADIYVPHAQLAIEIQRWATDFSGRSQGRKSQGAQVLWVITEDASGKNIRRALLDQPSVRVRVHEHGNRHKRVVPWLDHEQNSTARLSMGGRVAWWNEAEKKLRCGWQDGYGFIREVVCGQRIWVSGTDPLVSHLGGGVWVKKEDLHRAALFTQPKSREKFFSRLTRRIRMERAK